MNDCPASGDHCFMKKLIISIAFVIGCFLASPSEGVGQCPRADTEIAKTLKIVKGRASVKDTIRLCTGHVYRFRAKAGQSFSIKLTTGNKTGLTLMTPSGERLVDGDAMTWSGDLPEDGRYEIQIGTDATARYTLEISIK